MYGSSESLRYTPEMNITFYVNYTGIEKKKSPTGIQSYFQSFAKATHDE